MSTETLVQEYKKTAAAKAPIEARLRAAVRLFLADVMDRLGRQAATVAVQKALVSASTGTWSSDKLIQLTIEGPDAQQDRIEVRFDLAVAETKAQLGVRIVNRDSNQTFENTTPFMQGGVERAVNWLVSEMAKGLKKVATGW
jgi:hypothetical protein